MFVQLFHFFTLPQWGCLLFSAILLGFSKTGISSAMILAVPLLANGFGGKDSTGILLPMLIVGDLFAIRYYNRHAEWREIKNLMPWNIVGLIVGTVVGTLVDDGHFKTLIALSVLICLGILIATEVKRGELKIPKNVLIYSLLGILCGFTSMIGNAAGPIFSVYLLARQFKKYDFMGTTAWFFFINNLLKVPLQIFVWHNISLHTAQIAFVMIPAIALGAWLGAMLLQKINDRHFRWLIIIMTGLAALRLI